jgi:translation initiation factor IF-3
MFRGREITHREIGQNILKRVETDLKDIAITEQPSRLEGRLLFMIIAPNPRWLQAQKSRAEAAERAPAKQAAAAATSAPSSSASAASSGNGSPRAAAAPAVSQGAAPVAQARAEAPKA